ncbi:energy-coupling factor ABC transporter ATP-binding protein [Kurthia sibirica]|uniref:Energy-coupling factor transporter ATP-binding protein EcfA2 n=1 Tax=Kurthia sibirica TaxID=202750 RepID=A0A2U3AM36_9BACL|nr:energy-coupling factor ABC transporter ATP-binding protein [Kurthia sibirica]PWI25595.1 energy-coupling factor ABC transporter ATP-binding protein [Kurthia sibirica]GEK34104.1 energy-coupling factor transporter ATP-binding protein EcfA2 [Kurthia sibirica]
MDIELQKVSYSYAKGTPFEKAALFGVDLMIESGKYHAIIGHTGSGKSTVLQHLNALLKPSEGIVKIGDEMIEAGKKNKKLRQVRQHIGIVFQFPEHQLFEETVLKDIAFGPMNFGVSEEEAYARAHEVIKTVGLDDSILQKSPFDLSGGQMRRVAIAGVLAMKPDVIVLDEPTAGLDPRGRHNIMELFSKLQKDHNLTMILVTHSMEDAARYADDLTIMHDGKSVLRGMPREIFKDVDKLAQYRLKVPHVVAFQMRLEQRLGSKLAKLCLTEEDLVDEIARAAKKVREES